MKNPTHTWRKHISDKLTTSAFATAWQVIPRLPQRLAFALFDLAAHLTYIANGQGVRTLRENYRHLHPHLPHPRSPETLVRDGVRSYLRYWCELFRLPAMTPEDIRNSTRIEGLHHIRAAMGSPEQPRAVACFLSHSGNWDLAGAWAQLDLGPVVTVAERLQPESVFTLFRATRHALGMRIIALTGEGNVLRTLHNETSKPVIIPLLADRDLTGGGVAVTFPGGHINASVGPAALAITAGISVLPVTIHYEPTPETTSYRTVIQFHPPAPPTSGTTRQRVRDATRYCVDVIANNILNHPQDWHMMQPIYTPQGT
ncbi:phosphatidylinositol mannoside acyltransferase [Dermatophilus congolensis]|uniref:Phosphatidylinositol mannoside acyltransferase n=7 Tax=Dermatophilus congolensis TaxID=1863 RepID=A0A239VKF2_9MICO|nr:phosphatidylinositol mannoside acyltransferase [Dermatophilus congolensis]MBO3129356.1 phosphatidylinositol mannoside acyltransferase [Dermatophilus congolensis]MBO3132011.1 phosphatidylinositol mannoside acyltransferase [Dermatophilus congolensis]MBO3138307.1 phosphatidylinositol mannoside acyltransferase [Dermatophilus congolensis]MBO3140544.1 phosphatidylinositol mannoside acyltransferase [Dermatophilus congolensis]MBO3145414.1 phosphatidylinositol mannoside acyltransferase [Dermatophilu